MLRSFRRAALFIGLAACLGGAALAQNYAPTPVPTINPTDLIPDTVSGGQNAQQQFVTPSQISGTPGYTKAVPATGFSYTFGSSQTWMLLYPTGTLATGTVTAAANPSDGQRECVRSTQTITALTWSANTGQTINNAPTTLGNTTASCMTFSKSTGAWDPS